MKKIVSTKVISTRAKALTADTPNVNGLIYPKDVLEKAVADAQEKAEAGNWYGCLNVTASNVRLGDASHRVTAIHLEGDEVHAEIEVLDTRQGRLLAEILEAEVPWRLSPVGFGNAEDKTITEYKFGPIHVDTRIENFEPKDDD